MWQPQPQNPAYAAGAGDYVGIPLAASLQSAVSCLCSLVSHTSCVLHGLHGPNLVGPAGGQSRRMGAAPKKAYLLTLMM